MRILKALVATIALLLTIVFLPIVGGVLFAGAFFGLFVLALVAVLSGLEDRTVPRRNSGMRPTAWRDGA